MIQAISLLGSCLVIVWTIVMGFNVFGSEKVALIAFVFGIIAYPFLICSIMAGLKYYSLSVG
jgi:hypothetical protein